MNKKKLLYGALVAAQILVLVFMIARQENLLANGTKILLKCAPVDPRSLFSGDYVILNYDISRLKTSEKGFIVINGKTLSEGDSIYVALRKDKSGKYYEAADYGFDLKELRNKYPVIIRGKVYNLWADNYNVVYGIEQYFVPQNRGKEIEQDLRNVSVLVSVDEKGSSAVSRIYIEDKEVTFY
jgi:uncharacterized membrane-anchored protein